MKKLLALILAATMTIGMVVSAAATSADDSVSSPVAETVAVPEVVLSEENTGIIIELVATEDAVELTEEKQEVYTAAQDTLVEAAPEDMSAISFFYFQAFAEDEKGEKGEKTEITEPIDVTLKIDEVTEIENINEVKVMQFVDGEWVELEVVMNPDGTITIKGVVEGPLSLIHI